MIGLEFNKKVRSYCEQLKEKGMLCKETHENVIRLTPPLVISKKDLDWAFDQLKAVIDGE